MSEGYVHSEHEDCPCGPSVIYVHNEVTDHDTTEGGPPENQCMNEGEYDLGTAYCTLYRGHDGEHYRPAIQGREVSA